jgi:hypothetical protein
VAATIAKIEAKIAVIPSTEITTRASAASSTISRASSKAAIAPIASEAIVIASTRWCSERVRLVTGRSNTPPVTAAAINSSVVTIVSSGLSRRASPQDCAASRIMVRSGSRHRAR